MPEKTVPDLSIGVVARRTGMQPSALRYYESVGLLPKIQRVSGRRRYDSSVLQRLALIQAAQRAGFRIAEIQTLLKNVEAGTPASAQWHVLARQKLIEVDTLMTQAQVMKRLLEQVLNCNCSNLDECGATLTQIHNC
jgi:MerR family redox-sensitive transcriptional activator SoxR